VEHPRARPAVGQPAQRAQGGHGRAGGYAAAQFGLASAAFAAGGGTPGTSGTSGTVISGRHLSFVQGRPDNAMAVTAQLVSKTGMLPTRLRCFVDVGTEPGH